MSKINNTEIERKFLIKSIPENLEIYNKHNIKQAYISTDPTMRLRQQDNKYIFTFKGSGTILKQEFEYELTKEQFDKLWKKVETKKIVKTRYLIPIENNLIIELDIYKDDLEGFINAEVEFETLEQAENFIPPKWFGEEVTNDKRYSNSSLSINGIPVKNFKNSLRYFE